MYNLGYVLRSKVVQLKRISAYGGYGGPGAKPLATGRFLVHFWKKKLF